MQKSGSDESSFGKLLERCEEGRGAGSGSVGLVQGSSFHCSQVLLVQCRAVVETTLVESKEFRPIQDEDQGFETETMRLSLWKKGKGKVSKGIFQKHNIL